MSPDFNDPRHPWARLTAAARTVHDDRDSSAPYGFTTRMAALAFAAHQNVPSLFERFALRALGVASLLALGSVALNYNSINSEPAALSGPVVAANIDEVMLPTTDAVAVIFDIAD